MVSGELRYVSLVLSTVQDGVSPVYVSCDYGHTNVVNVLVKAGADVNQALTKVCHWCATAYVKSSQVRTYHGSQVAREPLFSVRVLWRCDRPTAQGPKAGLVASVFSRKQEWLNARMCAT